MTDTAPEKASLWPTLFLLAVGALITWYGLAAARNSVPAVLWITALGFGPLLVLLCVGVILRSLGRALRR